MKIGAHISTRKPFSDAVTRAHEIGCECMQIFANPPQRWNPIAISEEEVERFVDLNKKHDITPVIIHGIYLVNLASENSYFYKASVASLVDDMKKADKLGAVGVNFHVGSTKGNGFDKALLRVKDALFEILNSSPEDPYLILENSAGAGSIIGDTVEELAQIINAVKSERMRVLIDTAHAFASGYDLRTERGLEEFIAKFEKEIGLQKLVGFHLNDSKSDLSSNRDRHADIGHGLIGKEIFASIINHPKLKNTFGILETPEDNTSWSQQIKLLKSMRKS